MTIKEIAQKLKGNLLVAGNTAAEVKEVYAGDFLSRVMGKAPSGCVWLTVMGNVNVAGVAVLADIAAIVLCESVVPDNLLKAKCEDEGIALICTDLPVYESCKLL